MRGLLFLAERGIALQVRKQALCIRDADGSEELLYPRAHYARTIIAAGPGCSFTSEACRWIGREGVGLYLMERAGEALAVVTSAVETDSRRRAEGE